MSTLIRDSTVITLRSTVLYLMIILEYTLKSLSSYYAVERV